VQAAGEALADGFEVAPGDCKYLGFSTGGKKYLAQQEINLLES